jgi:hypothetical protein
MSMIQALGNVSKVRGALIFVEDAEEELSFYRDIIRRLDAAGVRHEDVIRTAYGSFCFLWDPEGNPLQFYESASTRPEVDAERLPG